MPANEVRHSQLVTIKADTLLELMTQLLVWIVANNDEFDWAECLFDIQCVTLTWVAHITTPSKV